jgi:hypothetical protein
MDDDLRNKFAPRRNKRYAHLRGFEHEAKWGRTLDWKTNEYDYLRLTRSIIDHLDSAFREEYGLRVAQLADGQQIRDYLRTSRTWYEQEGQLFETRGIYIFLHINMKLWLAGKAWDVVDKRRKQGLRAIHETTRI